jgi:predicted DCC family thiol-disulfide oxidoreductase YuxK
METDKHIANPIVYYDGECGFCNSFVRFLKRTSKAKRRLLFIPYQAVVTSVPGELLIVDTNSSFEAGNAAIQILYYAGGMFKIPAIILLLFPTNTLDIIYYYFAKNRYRWFGRVSCTIN